jgi:ABC-type nitrate/sulfonate/bicarbonate transport system substrate-binding protein
MQRLLCKLTIAIVLLLSQTDALLAAVLENIKVSYAVLSAAYMDHVTAMEKGYFRDEGLNVEVLRMGGGVATPALLSGQLHFSSSAGSSLSAAVRGGPLKIVYTNLSRPSYYLVATSANISSAKDLIGKRVVINSFGDTGHLATILYLRKHGINPASVLFITVGRNEVRLPALMSGMVDATPLAPRELVKLGLQKQKVLADLSKEIQLVWNGVAVSNKLLADNPQLVERFLRAIVKGREYARRYREETIAIIAKHDPSPLEGLRADYEVTKSSMTDEGWLPDDILREEVNIRAELTKVAVPANPLGMYDYSIVKKIYAQLKSTGWQPSR